MKVYCLYAVIIVLLFNACEFPEKKSVDSFCNPINLNYRFQLDEPSRREAADPSIIYFNDEYWMFLSKSGGYYHSKDMIEWEMIVSNDLPIEEYAPTIVACGDTLLFMTKNQKIYQTLDPLSAKWEIVNDSLAVRAFDPTLFLDDDNRLYLYHGLSARTPIKGVELDREILQPIGEQQELLASNKDIYGWERPGDYNFGSKRRPWVEGAFVTKHNDVYFLHYSVPGTQFKSYADGMYISDKPLGPYTFAPHNPFSYKPEGFIAGAGHGSTFQDKYGNYWYAGTMTVAVKHRLERRIGLFPAFFDDDNCFYAYTGFGDYPHDLPTKKMDGYKDYVPSMMLLSYKKTITASSSKENYPVENSVDEDIQTIWSAKTGEKGEWLMIDLNRPQRLGAIQINFADVDTKVLGRDEALSYKYLVEHSNDGVNWKILIDKIDNKIDLPHDYILLDSSVKARFIRITNYGITDGKFAISDFRIFGHGDGDNPERVDAFQVKRDKEDACIVRLNWEKSKDAIGYNIRYGIAPDKLYLNYHVLGADSVSIHSLNSLKDYYFTIDAFNENGITNGEKVVCAPITEF